LKYPKKVRAVQRGRLLFEFTHGAESHTNGEKKDEKAEYEKMGGSNL
jgi:hypothetical protein